MATTKKAIYKVHNGTDFDTIHFETEASQVKTAAGSDVETQLAKKANIEQEVWQTPTLLNGWVNRGTEGDAPASYFKDQFGLIHIQGMIKSGTITGGTIIFVLPQGYRPLYNAKLIVNCNSSLGFLTVSPNGAIYIDSIPSNVWVSLNSITFLAEQ